MISGPIESHPGMSQRKRVIIHKMNVAGEKYLGKENKFRRGECMPEDCLHMEMIKNFWTCMKTAFEEEPRQDKKKNPCVRKKFRKIFGQKHSISCVTHVEKNDKHKSNKCK